MDKKEFIKNLININNDANASIVALETDAKAIKMPLRSIEITAG